MNTTSTAAASVSPALVEVAQHSALESTRVKLTNAEKLNLAHNLMVALKTSGLAMDSFRRSQGVVVSWTAMNTALKGSTNIYQVKTMRSFCVLAGLPMAQLTKPQSDRKPLTEEPAATTDNRTPITVEGYSRNQPTGSRKNPVIKPVKVSAHTKVPGLRGEAASTEAPAVNENIATGPVAKAGSILFQIGSEVLHLPLANLKSVMCNEDGTLTFTVKP